MCVVCLSARSTYYACLDYSYMSDYHMSEVVYQNKISKQVNGAQMENIVLMNKYQGSKWVRNTG